MFRLNLHFQHFGNFEIVYIELIYVIFINFKRVIKQTLQIDLFSKISLYNPL
jgi:hypothetical protein